jgi:hypothetical protein
MVVCCAQGHAISSFIKDVADFLLAVVFPKEPTNKETYSKAISVVLSLRIFQFLKAIFLLLRLSTFMFE